MEFDKEIQFSLFENFDGAFGLHLDDLLAARQYDIIQWWFGQNDQNVGHNNWKFDPKPAERTYFAHNKNHPVHKGSDRQLRERRDNKILGLEGKQLYSQPSIGGRHQHDDADGRAGNNCCGTGQELVLMRLIYIHFYCSTFQNKACSFFSKLCS